MPKPVLILRQGKAKRKQKNRKCNFFLTAEENLMPKTRAAVVAAGIKVVSQKRINDKIISTTYSSKEKAIAAGEEAGYKVIPYQALRSRE